ncbi:MAG: 4-hydroxy-4-methyl-2-oxoglutarate aldolase [Alphaproteobacteria bacterium]|nr:4-hydroxy-4-methyl-2-oxoglutarate aldolase [Alphaproteobacteria bacterium]
MSSDFARPSAAELAAAASISASTIHEAAGKIGALPAPIKPLDPKITVCGPAFTVRGAPGDNLWLHHALDQARPGDVLVVNVGGHYEAGYWGEVMTVSAQARGLAGLVINGCVRDGQAMVDLGFPVFARGTCMRGTEKDHNFKGDLAQPLPMGDVLVNPGDLVIGDGDGVVVIPREQVGDAIAASNARDAREVEMMEVLRTGKTTVEIYGWELK